MQIKTLIQLDITSHWSEWSSSKILQTINAAGGVKKREFYSVGGNVLNKFL